MGPGFISMLPPVICKLQPCLLFFLGAGEKKSIVGKKKKPQEGDVESGAATSDHGGPTSAGKSRV